MQMPLILRNALVSAIGWEHSGHATPPCLGVHDPDHSVSILFQSPDGPRQFLSPIIQFMSYRLQELVRTLLGVTGINRQTSADRIRR